MLYCCNGPFVHVRSSCTGSVFGNGSLPFAHMYMNKYLPTDIEVAHGNNFAYA